MWERQGRERDWRRGTLGGDKGARAGNKGVRQTYGDATTGECKLFWENQEGQRWGVICAEWNGMVYARRNNARGLEYCQICTQDSWDRKGLEEGKRIQNTSINIRTGREGGPEAALCALQQGNINVEVFQ